MLIYFVFSKVLVLLITANEFLRALGQGYFAFLTVHSVRLCWLCVDSASRLTNARAAWVGVLCPRLSSHFFFFCFFPHSRSGISVPLGRDPFSSPFILLSFLLLFFRLLLFISLFFSYLSLGPPYPYFPPIHHCSLPLWWSLTSLLLVCLNTLRELGVSGPNPVDYHKPSFTVLLSFPFLYFFLFLSFPCLSQMALLGSS